MDSTPRRTSTLEEIEVADMTGQVTVYVRHLIRRDLAEVLAIENASFEDTWSEADFMRALRSRNASGYVAECNELVIAYVIVLSTDDGLEVINLAVSPQCLRLGVGGFLVGKLQEGGPVVLKVRESNLGAQLFFKSIGFLAVEVIRGFYPDVDDDAYVMECLPAEVGAAE